MSRAFLLAAAAALAIPAPAIADELRDMVTADLSSLTAIYRDLHQHPELSFQEVRSAKVMADAARKAGFDVTEKVGKTGVVAVLRNGPGPTVLIRADMDALPVEEQTGLAYASKVRAKSASGVDSGVMHACGHDTHMASWIGAARALARHRDQWSGTLVMIGQPAEEIVAGAEAMLADGLFTRFPKPDFALALHDSADLGSGVIGVTPGFALANVNSVDITVKGLGGHGAYPQTTRDPIVLASAIVTRLQTLVSREADAFDPAVVTVGSIHGGAKHNIIPDEVKLQLTVRSYSAESRKRLLDGIARIAAGEAMAAGMPADKMPVVAISPEKADATWNTPALSQRVATHFRERFGAERVAAPTPSMAAEDFGVFAKADPERIQSLIFWVGARPQAELDAAKREGRVLHGLHSPFWAPDADQVIATGAEALAAAAMHLMPKS